MAYLFCFVSSSRMHPRRYSPILDRKMPTFIRYCRAHSRRWLIGCADPPCNVTVVQNSRLSIVEFISGGDPSTERPAPPNETLLRVGPLQLDLLDRTARRGDRKIDLRPREFQLLKYMMQRSDKLLTRAMLFKEVWHYKFVPETNLVDVHMGRLRRKVDGPNEAPMICNVRGAGFVLSAIPAFQDLPTITAEQSTVARDKSPQSLEGTLQ